MKIHSARVFPRMGAAMLKRHRFVRSLWRWPKCVRGGVRRSLSLISTILFLGQLDINEGMSIYSCFVITEIILNPRCRSQVLKQNRQLSTTKLFKIYTVVSLIVHTRTCSVALCPEICNDYSTSCSWIRKNIFRGALAPRKNNCVSHCSKLKILFTPQDKFDRNALLHITYDIRHV